MPQSDSNYSIPARIYLAILATLAVAACFFPLADHVGYEFSEGVALCAGLFGCIPGFAFPAKRALRFSLLALLLPLAIILPNGLRRPACDPLHGLPLYFALTIPSALLSVSLALLVRKARWFAILFAATLAWSLWPIFRGPQVFAYHHLGGMFPGPIYDESIGLTDALLWFRAATILYAAACLGAAGKRYVVAAVALIPAIGISLNATRLHFRASVEQIDEQLGGRLETPHLILHFPREKPPEERALLSLDAEADANGVLQFLGVPAAQKIDVWLYRNAAEKRLLIGAADTSFTKPWLRQIHTNDMNAPHAILRHELVHALAAPIAHGPWGVPGLFPNMALIEGLAVAGDWPPGEFTVHEEARAMRELKLLPDLTRLFQPLRFYDESGPRAYTAAGSFIRWFWETHGAPALRNVYSGAESFDTGTLVPQYLKFLDSLSEPPRAIAIAQQRFFSPGITRKPCAHEVAALQEKARGEREPAIAAALWAKCSELEPDDPAVLLSLRKSQLAAGELAQAQETEQRALQHPKLSQPLKAQLLIESGDTAWKAGNVPLASQRFAEASALTQAEAAERALVVRTLAIKDPPTWSALRPLLADSDTGPQTLLALRDLDLARPRDGLFAYLLAKQLQNARNWEGCFAYAQSAISRGLPGASFYQEALRMRGISAWHLGNSAAARAAFGQLANRLEAERWIARLK